MVSSRSHAVTMEINCIHPDADKYELTKAFETVLHGPEFYTKPPADEQGRVNTKDRKMNFQVILHKPRTPTSGRHNGSGFLRLPEDIVGRHLLDWMRAPGNRISVHGRSLRLHFAPRMTQEQEKEIMQSIPHSADVLQKAPFVDPDIEADRESKIEELNKHLRIESVQIGVLYMDSPTPKSPIPGPQVLQPHNGVHNSRHQPQKTRGGKTQWHRLPTDTKNQSSGPQVLSRGPQPQRSQSRSFSVEWEHDCVEDVAWLWMNYDHKTIWIQFGNPVNAQIKHTFIIKFVSINKIATGFDTGRPYIVFDLHTPVIIETEDYHRSTSGDDFKDSRGYRHRMTSFNDAHATIAPYAHHLRLLLVKDSDLKEFGRLCQVSGIPTPIDLSFNGGVHNIEASKRELFTRKQIREVEYWVRSLDWAVTFQIELLLHNGLINTHDALKYLRPYINNLYEKDPQNCADFLRAFAESLQSPARPPAEKAPLDTFQRLVQEKKELPRIATPPGMFSCRHVTFTPTRMLLEGPYAIQSNRVIRRYKYDEDHFIRVDFRDEDRLAYRWDFEVDGTSFLRNRVGVILKNGFELGGRRFEFLAYSSSALREHSVWFMTPFQNRYPAFHGSADIITAAEIRQTLGDFSGVAHQPAKYAARMAQAFTATDPSVTITRAQWEQIPDLGIAPFEHTDGVGVISPKLADKIWDQLCRDQPRLQARKIKPSVYQIRFLGYKGMVGVDERLDGEQMRLRPSMNKFRAHQEDEAEIEIAKAFDRPMVCMLSRPLIMILEDRGVHCDVFMGLQNDAKKETYLSEDYLEEYTSMLRNQGLGASFRLMNVARGLLKLGLDFKPPGDSNSVAMQYGFFRRLTQFGIHHALREIKHYCRIPVKKGWLLPGIADEGPRYIAEGESNVFALKEGEIFLCVQGPEDEEPNYVSGRAIIWRSPTVHPGDVQHVFAVGKPPPNMLCAFRNLKNVVVLPSVGDRSLASQLGGGDVDGDIFSVAKEFDLFPTLGAKAADYEAVKPFSLPDGRMSEIEDVCDFVVNYIGSDVLGLLSTNHLIIADQSKDGTADERCLELAKLCSWAVDYPKSGVPVDMKNSPRRYIPYNPDWQSAEVVDLDKKKYYHSTRALGNLYRSFELPTREKLFHDDYKDTTSHFEDNVSVRLLEQIRQFIPHCAPRTTEPEWLVKLFQHYLNELRYICATHTLSSLASARLLEEEVVVGTILAQCTQRRWRADRIQRMKDHSRVLVHHVERVLHMTDDITKADEAQLKIALERAWDAWCFSMRYRTHFGGSSFGIIALGLTFAIIDNLLEKEAQM